MRIVKLPRVELDYIAAARRPRAVGIALLLASLICAGSVLERYLEARTAGERFVAARALLPGEHHATRKRSTGDQMKHAQAVVGQLALPWAAMIRSVEMADSPEVALMQMEPDPRERRLRVMAEAKNEQSMLEYVRRLGLANDLTDVHLANHQILLEDPKHPYQFTALARLR
jgi:hypothetical protein